MRQGDVLERLAELPSESVHCVVTSPPYFGQRNYGAEGQIGVERSIDEYVAKMVAVFAEVRRVLRRDGTFWVNLGDGYHSRNRGGYHRDGERGYKGGPIQMGNIGSLRRAGADGPASNRLAQTGLKAKDLMMMPARVALALQADGWWIRSEITWCKPSPMPESVQGSRWERHWITIKEYEKLSRLPSFIRADEGSRPALSNLSESQGEGISTNGSLPNSAPEISGQPQGADHYQSTGTAPGYKGKEAVGESIPIRPAQQSQIHSDSEGTGGEGAVAAPVAEQSQREGVRRRSASAPQDESAMALTQARDRSSLSSDTQGQSGSRGHVRTSQGAEGAESWVSDDAGMAGDPTSEQGPLFLLQTASETDDGSRNTTEQGRTAHDEQRRGGLPALQLAEERPNTPSLVECPGCAKCAVNDGFILRISAGRPTSATEKIYLLTRSSRYFYDLDAERVAFAAPERDQAAARRARAIESHKSMPTAERNGIRPAKQEGHRRRHAGFNERWDEAEANGSAPTGRNLWNYWIIPPEPFRDAHFATFPSELPRRCISLGTSAKGVCAACGAPWVRVVERTGHINGREPAHVPLNSPTKTDSTGWQPTTRATDSWRPSCKHEAEIVPATVLDPFAGSGTTLLAAIRMERSAIGIELNPAYVEMARKRIIAAAPLLNGCMEVL